MGQLPSHRQPSSGSSDLNIGTQPSLEDNTHILLFVHLKLP